MNKDLDKTVDEFVNGSPGTVEQKANREYLVKTLLERWETNPPKDQSEIDERDVPLLFNLIL